jgi:hypothetical protein
VRRRISEDIPARVVAYSETTPSYSSILRRRGAPEALVRVDTIAGRAAEDD